MAHDTTLCLKRVIFDSKNNGGTRNALQLHMSVSSRHQVINLMTSSGIIKQLNNVPVKPVGNLHAVEKEEARHSDQV